MAEHDYAEILVTIEVLRMPYHVKKTCCFRFIRWTRYWPKHYTDNNDDNSGDVQSRGVQTKVLPENPNKWCDRLGLNFQENEGANQAKRFDLEPIAIFYQPLEHRGITAVLHKRFLSDFSASKCLKYMKVKK